MTATTRTSIRARRYLDLTPEEQRAVDRELGCWWRLRQARKQLVDTGLTLAKALAEYEAARSVVDALEEPTV